MVRVPLVFSCVLWLALAAPQGVRAQDRPADYPNRPIRIVLPVVPGGGLDIIARSVGQMLTDRWGQSVIIGGLISSTLLARLVTPVLYKLLAPEVEPEADEAPAAATVRVGATA